MGAGIGVKVTQKDVNRLIALRDKAAAGDTDAKAEFDTIAQKLIYARRVPEHYFSDLLRGTVSENLFRLGIGFPIIDLNRFFEEYVSTGTRTGKFHTTHVRSLNSQLPRFFNWLAKNDIHPSDLTSTDLDRHIQEVGAFRPTTAKVVKAFWRWLEREKDVPIHASIRTLKVEIAKGAEEYYRVFISDLKPEIPKSQKGVRKFPTKGWVQISPTKWFYSELNLIYSTLYEHSDMFDDWRRLEICLRVLRETGMRWVHARWVQWSDIDFLGKEHGGVPVIDYRKIYPKVLKGKHLPIYPTPISPLLARRINEYRTNWRSPAIEADDTYIFMFKLTRNDKLTPTSDYRPFFGREASNNIYHILYRIRDVGRFAKCFERADASSICPLCLSMFRHSRATLLGNILPSDRDLELYFGDEPSTIKAHYRAAGLIDYYRSIGLSSYDDILTKVFSNEGLYLDEEPEGKLKRGRKKTTFTVEPISPLLRRFPV